MDIIPPQFESRDREIRVPRSTLTTCDDALKAAPSFEQAFRRDTLRADKLADIKPPLAAAQMQQDRPPPRRKSQGLLIMIHDSYSLKESREHEANHRTMGRGVLIFSTKNSTRVALAHNHVVLLTLYALVMV